jgi:hypothetical protein
MIMRQTIDIPANREVTIRLVVPETVPCGKQDVILDFPTDPFAGLGAYLRANTPTTIEEAKKEAAAKLADPNRKPFSRHFGALKGAFGDGMEYQRGLRDEWN